ncbi:MAG: sulfatase-like hydrolase/transferase [Verrucomicrobiae bacterium]|nr:sulfatase-like hydrolase/transferase [Verrucomicrobiae bacterium]
MFLRLLFGLLIFCNLSAWAQDRPNFLFIIADDQAPFDLKAYEPESSLQTPNLDRLAREGMVIDQAYHMGAWVSGVCTPSRHMIMSGRTLWHAPNRPGRDDNPNFDNPKMVPPNILENTLPAVFNRAGYDTMRTCKPGNSYAAANELFTVLKQADKRGGTHESGSGWHGAVFTRNPCRIIWPGILPTGKSWKKWKRCFSSKCACTMTLSGSGTSPMMD